MPYFHVVFTVPEGLNVIALHAPRIFYDLLFRAAGAALVDVAHSRLQIQPGCLSVLHTWGQTLTLHPHIHCVVPGGGFWAYPGFVDGLVVGSGGESRLTLLELHG